jgi:hypothetical protein
MKNELIAEAIERAALVIRLPGWWTQGGFARTKGRRVVGYRENAAVCFCALGATREAAREIGGDDLMWAADSEVFHVKGGIADFNDAKGRTAEEVSDAMLACAADLRKKATA